MQKYVFYSDLQNNSYLCTLKMHRFALIGRRLGHSYSQRWFEAKFKDLGLTDCTYVLHEMETLAGLRQWVERDGIEGFNVTVPYKQEIIPLLDGLDEAAAAIGAVNCVTVRHGRLVGHNTDAPAFRQSLENTGWQVQQAFVLGTGGAARAVAYALDRMHIPYRFVSRHPDRHPDAISYSQLTQLAQPLSHSASLLIVNATPVGMYPDVDATPLNLSAFNYQLSTVHVYDLTYNPSPTRLMRDAASRGATVNDGLEMLHRQAELSWTLFSSNT